MYTPPDMPRWQHRLLLAIPCFDGEPSAAELAQSCGLELSSCVTYLGKMRCAGHVAVAHHVDDCGRLPSTYRLTEAGDRLFEQLIDATESLKRLAKQRRSILRLQRRGQRQ